MRVLFLLGAMAMTGCASVSVANRGVNPTLAPSSRPRIINVRNFDVARGAEFDVAHIADEAPAEQRVGGYVASEVVRNSQDLGIPSTRWANRSAVPPRQGLLVDGSFTQVRQGSRGLRLLIGMGAGRSRMDTRVRVFNLEKSTTRPWLTFETTGGSNSEPGLVLAIVPSPLSVPLAVTLVGGAATVAGSGLKGVSFDGSRTGREIAAAIHEQLAAQGLVQRETKPKLKGKLSTPVGRLGFGNSTVRRIN